MDRQERRKRAKRVAFENALDVTVIQSSVALHSMNSLEIRTDATFDFCNKMCTFVTWQPVLPMSVQARPEVRGAPGQSDANDHSERTNRPFSVS